MSQNDGTCPFCGAGLTPNSSLCPSCGRSIFQPQAPEAEAQKVQPPQPRHIALTRRNLIIGLIAIILIAIVPFAIFANASRGASPGTPPSSNTTLSGASATTPTPTPSAPTPTPPTLTQTPADLSPTASGTPTSAPVVSLPCNVDLNTWTGGSSDWVTHNGIVYNDGTNTTSESSGPTLVAPCQPGVANYALEAKIQVTHPSGCFGLVLRATSGQNGWQGYRAGTCGPDSYPSNTAYIQAYGDNDPLVKVPFTSNTNVHTYRVEIKDTSIKLFIDGNLIDSTTDNRLLTVASGEEVGLYSVSTQIQVTSFKVTALPA